jgi:1-deoxy-D-xylulose-5-phosphate synthase
MLDVALLAGDALDATVVNMRFVKPLDTSLILDMASRHGLIVTLEENVIAGGAGSAVAEALAHHGVVVELLNFGLPDSFVDHGEQGQLLASIGLDAPSLTRSVGERMRLVERSARLETRRVAAPTPALASAIRAAAGSPGA